MKINEETQSVPFGEFVTTAYDVLGKRRAKRMVWLAVNAGLVEFHGPQRIVFSRRGEKNLSPF